MKWPTSNAESLREASTTAVTTYPRVSKIGVWDGSGNVWEWMANPSAPGDNEMALRRRLALLS